MNTVTNLIALAGLAFAMTAVGAEQTALSSEVRRDLNRCSGWFSAYRPNLFDLKVEKTKEEQVKWVADAEAACTRVVNRLRGHADGFEPALARALIRRGEIRGLRADYEEALRDFSEAVRLVPDDTDAHTARGGALLRLRRSDEAVADFTKVLELGGASYGTYASRANAYLQMKSYPTAIADYEAARAHIPADAPRAWFETPIDYGVGIAKVGMGDDSGWKLIDGAIAQDGDHLSKGYANLGIAPPQRPSIGPEQRKHDGQVLD